MIRLHPMFDFYTFCAPDKNVCDQRYSASVIQKITNKFDSWALSGLKILQPLWGNGKVSR